MAPAACLRAKLTKSGAGRRNRCPRGRPRPWERAPGAGVTGAKWPAKTGATCQLEFAAGPRAAGPGVWRRGRARSHLAKWRARQTDKARS